MQVGAVLQFYELNLSLKFIFEDESAKCEFMIVGFHSLNLNKVYHN